MLKGKYCGQRFDVANTAYTKNFFAFIRKEHFCRHSHCSGISTMKPDASKCVPFEQKKEEEEEDVDYYQFGAILCALVGMFFRVRTVVVSYFTMQMLTFCFASVTGTQMKLLSWTSVFLSMASIATTKTTKLTMMNIASSLM